MFKMKNAFIFCLLVSATCVSTMSQKKTIVTGIILAHGVSDYPVMRGNGSRVFILRNKNHSTQRQKKEKPKSEFVIVYSFGEVDVPIELYNGISVGKFELTRVKRCDTSIAEFDEKAIQSSQKQVSGSISEIPFPNLIVLVPGAKENEIPNHEVLPCYKLVKIDIVGNDSVN